MPVIAKSAATKQAPHEREIASLKSARNDKNSRAVSL